MAEKKAETNEEAPPKKKGKLLLFIIIGALVVILAGAGIAFKLMSNKHAAADAEDDGEGTTKTERSSKAKRDKPEAPPVFVKVEPFTVKLQTEQQDAYLQTTPELKVLDMPVGERVKQYMPEIRHRVLLILSGRKASEISSPQGVQKLSNEIRKEINLIIDGPKKPKGKSKGKGKDKEEETPSAETSDQADEDDSVQAVLFTSFIIQ